MDTIYLTLVRHHPQARMVEHLVSSYTQWWGLRCSTEETDGDCWRLRADNGIVTIAANERHVIPRAVDFLLVHLSGKNFYLPIPSDGVKEPSAEAIKPTASFASLAKGEIPAPLPDHFGVDLLCFLGGQIWRAEELEPEHYEQACNADASGFLGERYGFFDWPIADLWMRLLFEKILGYSLPAPHAWRDPLHPESAQTYPRFWMSYDIDCLRKWKPRSILKHSALFPSYVLASRTREWLRLWLEALRARTPERDPWYTVPHMLEACRNITATFFWLGHPFDHLAERYDIEKPEYRVLLQRVRDNHHSIGLHGNPLHAENLEALRAEKQKLERLAALPITLSRQHFLRVIPGKTLPLLDQIGIRLDSSMGFNSRTGFRCATAIPHRWWDFTAARALNLRELPPIAGDWSLHDPRHFDAIASRHRLWDLADRVRLGGGIIALIFHDLYFARSDYPDHADFHQSVLEGFWMRHWRDWTPPA